MKHPDQLWGPLNLLSIGYRGTFLGTKQLDVQYHSTSITKAKHEWNYTSTPQVSLQGWDRDNLFFYKE